MGAYLKLENLSKNFGKVKALSNINLEIEEGIFCVILGPSGCGKSTLLNLIAGLEEPSSGRIYLGGKDITETPPHKRDIAMVFQNYALYPHLSVFENMAFGLRIRGLKEDQIREKVRRVSRILNIEDKLHNFPRELSGGQRQRVATGRAMVREPKLFLFDEPLSNLDARLRVELRAEFIKLHRQLKKTVVYVTHDQIEAMVLGEIIVVIKEGKIQQISTPQQLYHEPRNLFVAEFIGTVPMNIIELNVVKIDNRIILTRGDFRFQPPENFIEQLRRFVNKKVYFGFRPSTVTITEEGRLKGEVIFTETFGEDNFIHIRLNGEVEINVKIEEDLKLEPGDLVSIAIDSAHMYFFDSLGARIS